jgi:hypothetical protein
LLLLLLLLDAGPAKYTAVNSAHRGRPSLGKRAVRLDRQSNWQSQSWTTSTAGVGESRFRSPLATQGNFVGLLVFLLLNSPLTTQGNFFRPAAQIKSTKCGSKWIAKDGVELGLFVLTFEPTSST